MRASLPEGYRIEEPISPFAEHVGPILVRQVDGEWRCAFVAERRHCNRQGAVHGGMLMTFADVALAHIGRKAYAEESVSVSFSFEFLAPARLGDLVEARAEILRRTGSLNFVRGQLLVGDTVIVNCSTVEKRLKRK
jgi:uncharacterized protein (TIGR00369 family)